MKRIVLIIALLLVVVYSCNRSNYSNLQKNDYVAETVPEAVAEDVTEAATEVVTEPREYHLSILIAGDFMQHGPQITAALQPDSSYNYDECFARVKPVIEDADVAIGNLEVTLGGKPYAGYPQFRAPDEYLQAIVDAGIDIILTANNHCLDSGKHGLERTIMMMDSVGVPHIGTYVDEFERDENYPYILEQNGIRVAILNFTYGTNGLAVEEPNIVNMMDTAIIAVDLITAKEVNPDVIIAIPHWGIEYQSLPSKEQRRMADWLIENGVNHVIGGHPHVAQPMELLNDGKNFVAYSLGNVISNQSKPNTYGGYMVRLDFVKNDSLTMLSDCAYIPYWVSRPHDNGFTHNYRILPLDEPNSLLTAKERQQRDTISKAMRTLFKEHNVGDIKELGF
ncbi:MAG: capsular biosynthesis protein [Bacteroidetes bacterium]|nr:capsular biosynthesis protein [Bacteroidota bacterium]